MSLPWVTQEKKELLPTFLKDKIRDDREISTFDRWRTTEGKERLPGLALAETKTRLDKPSNRYVEIRPHHDLQEVLDSCGGIAPAVELQSSSWDDVMTSIDAAKVAYAEKATKNKGRGVLRSRPAMTTLHVLSQVIPEQDGLSVLRGGLTLMFKLIERRIENQEKILGTLENVPLIFEGACGDLTSFHYDEILVGRIRDLYTTLVEEIAALLRILLRKPKGSFREKLFRQHPEQEAVAIDKSLEQVRRASEAVETRTKFLRDQKMSQLHDSVLQSRDAARAVSGKVEEGFQSFAEQAELLLADAVRAFDRRITEAVSQIERAPKIEEAIRLQTGMYHFFTECLLQQPPAQIFPLSDQRLLRGMSLESQVPNMEDHGQLYPAQSSPFVEVTIEQLFDVVGIDAVVEHQGDPHAPPHIRQVADDLEAILRRSDDLQESALRRANWLMVTDRFKFWLGSGEQGPPSDLILVDGHCDDDSTNSISPLSIFCASLASMMIRQGNHTGKEIVLHHFCGIHAHHNDPLRGPAGLIRRLIAQLAIYLSRRGMNVRLVDRELLHDAGPGGGYELNALCVLLGQLLDEVPQGLTVFIIIDNASDFESRALGWRDEMALVAQHLRDIGLRRSAPSLKARVRTMMTCGMRSIAVAGHLHRNDRISLEAENEYEQGMG